MSFTHGGKRRPFDWYYDPERKILVIESERMRHEYPVHEIEQILCDLHEDFGSSFFPLANNVEKLGKETEKPGLGMAILSQEPKDITHAQGSSYLGVVLEEIGYCKWNGKKIGIEWRIIDKDFDQESIISRLIERSGQEKTIGETKNDKDQKYAKILGLEGKLTREDIKKKYRETIAQYHPDKVRSMGKELQDLAEQKSKEINEAFEYFAKKYKIS